MNHVSDSFHCIRYGDVLSRSELQTEQVLKYYRGPVDAMNDLKMLRNRTKAVAQKLGQQIGRLSTCAVETAMFTANPACFFQ